MIFDTDESWIHYFNPEIKSQSKEWHKLKDRLSHKTRAVLSVGKVTLTVVCDCEGIIFMDYLAKGTTINAKYYLILLSRSDQILNDLRWELIPHPPYSPNLAPSDYHLF